MATRGEEPEVKAEEQAALPAEDYLFLGGDDNLDPNLIEETIIKLKLFLESSKRLYGYVSDSSTPLLRFNLFDEKIKIYQHFNQLIYWKISHGGEINNSSNCKHPQYEIYYLLHSLNNFTLFW